MVGLSREENNAPVEPGGSLYLIPSSHSHVDVDVDPCSFLAFEAIGEDSAVASRGNSGDELPTSRIVAVAVNSVGRPNSVVR